MLREEAGRGKATKAYAVNIYFTQIYPYYLTLCKSGFYVRKPYRQYKQACRSLTTIDWMNHTGMDCCMTGVPPGASESLQMRIRFLSHDQ